MALAINIFTKDKAGGEPTKRPEAVDIVQELLDKRQSPDKDINAQAWDGTTAAYMASSYGNIPIIRKLIEAKADFNCPNAKSTPAFIAAQHGHAGAIQMLSEANVDFNLSLSGENDYSPVHVAAESGHLDVLNVLAELKADINSTNNRKGANPAYAAAQQGHVDVLRRLVELKVSPDQTTTAGDAPVHIAAREGHASVIKALAECKANLDLYTNQSLTPLMIAAQYNQISAIEALKEGKADPQRVSKTEGYTAAMYAAYFQKPDAIKTLATIPTINLNAFSKSGQTVLDWAFIGGDPNTIKTVIECGGTMSHLVFEEMEKKDTDLAAFVMLQILKKYITRHLPPPLPLLAAEHFNQILAVERRASSDGYRTLSSITIDKPFPPFDGYLPQFLAAEGRSSRDWSDTLSNIIRDSKTKPMYGLFPKKGCPSDFTPKNYLWAILQQYVVPPTQLQHIFEKKKDKPKPKVPLPSIETPSIESKESSQQKYISADNIIMDNVLPGHYVESTGGTVTINGNVGEGATVKSKYTLTVNGNAEEKSTLSAEHGNISVKHVHNHVSIHSHKLSVLADQVGDHVTITSKERIDIQKSIGNDCIITSTSNTGWVRAKNIGERTTITSVGNVTVGVISKDAKIRSSEGAVIAEQVKEHTTVHAKYNINIKKDAANSADIVSERDGGATLYDYTDFRPNGIIKPKHPPAVSLPPKSIPPAIIDIDFQSSNIREVRIGEGAQEDRPLPASESKSAPKQIDTTKYSKKPQYFITRKVDDEQGKSIKISLNFYALRGVSSPISKVEAVTTHHPQSGELCLLVTWGNTTKLINFKDIPSSGKLNFYEEEFDGVRNNASISSTGSMISSFSSQTTSNPVSSTSNPVSSTNNAAESQRPSMRR